jgi:hypothetical protein
VTTIKSDITKDMTAAEAANLLAKLEEGHRAAWLSAREAPRNSADRHARLQNAAEVDGVFRDIMRETVENGMRRPGEPVEDFAERAASEARLADSRGDGPEPPTSPVIRPAGAGMPPERAGHSQDEIINRLLDEAWSPKGQAHTWVFSDAAEAYVKELRQRDPLPEPDRTPGAPHPDPFLAARGWQINDHGIYTRGAEPEPHAPREHELEAGS